MWGFRATGWKSPPPAPIAPHVSLPFDQSLTHTSDTRNMRAICATECLFQCRTFASHCFAKGTRRCKDRLVLFASAATLSAPASGSASFRPLECLCRYKLAPLYCKQDCTVRSAPKTLKYGSACAVGLGIGRAISFIAWRDYPVQRAGHPWLQTRLVLVAGTRFFSRSRLDSWKPS